MTISAYSWNKFVANLSKISTEAARKMGEFIQRTGYGDTQALIDYAYALATKYGEASSALACEFYDAIAALMNQIVPAAAPAPTATYEEVANTVIGVVEGSQNPETLSGAVERLVKLAGEDTTLQNAARDGALVAWIPSGDTCAFCIALASRGWQTASRKLVKNGHAEHVHANCDCTYQVRYDDNFRVAGYDPARYRAMYDAADGRSSQDKINAMRREFYAENREEINAQKRSAYAKRMELNSSAAEEENV